MKRNRNKYKEWKKEFKYTNNRKKYKRLTHKVARRNIKKELKEELNAWRDNYA